MARSRSIRLMERLATASPTSGPSGSAGGSSGVHGGRKCRTTLAGTASRLATRQPARSRSTTSTSRPSGSARAANAATASPIRAALTRGSSAATVWPVAGRAKP